MFERFTDKSRRAVVLAQQEARLLNHGYIGTEHLLAGLCRVDGGAAAKALTSQGITTDAVRAEIETAVGRGQDPPSGHIPFTPQAKKALELSLREALQLGHNYIGTGHLLLGLTSLDDDDVAVRMLGRLGAGPDQLRARVSQEIEGNPEEDVPPVQVGPQDTIQRLLDAIDGRLSAIERHLGIVRPVPGQLRRYDQQITMIRHDKEAAIERQDFEAAAALRDREKQLLAERAQAVDKVVASQEPSGEGTDAGRDPGPAESSETGASTRPGGRSETGASTRPGGRSETRGRTGPGDSSELARLRAEVARLRAMLGEHDIDPGPPGDAPAAG